LPVGTEDRTRAERLATEAVAIAKPTGAEVVLTHVFTDDGFDGVRSKLGVDHAGEVVAAAETIGADRVVGGGRRRSPTGKACSGASHRTSCSRRRVR